MSSNHLVLIVIASYLFLGVVTNFDTIVQEIKKKLEITITTTTNQHYCTTITTTPIAKTLQ
jgi:hypothetical protein